MNAATTPQLAGLPKALLDTPALLLDLDRFESNSRRLVIPEATMTSASPAFAQVTPTAPSASCRWAMSGDLWAFECGRQATPQSSRKRFSVLIANELASRPKLDRVARLQDRAEVMVCADDPVHVEMAGAAGTAHGVEIPMLVEVDIGMERCGNAPGRAGVDLARLIARTPGGRFAGRHGLRGPRRERLAVRDQGDGGPHGDRSPGRHGPPHRAGRPTGGHRERRRLGELHVHRTVPWCDRGSGRGSVPDGPLLRRGVPSSRAGGTSSL